VVLLQRTSAAGNKSMLLDKGGPPSQLGGRFYALLVQLSLPKSSSAPVGGLLIGNERTAAHRKTPWGDELLRIPQPLGRLLVFSWRTRCTFIPLASRGSPALLRAVNFACCWDGSFAISPENVE